MLIILSACLETLSYFLHAAEFTTQYVRLVGQEPAPSKCVLLSTSREVRKEYEELGSFSRGRSMVCKV